MREHVQGWLAAFALVLSVLGGCAGSQDDAAQRRREGRALFSSGAAPESTESDGAPDAAAAWSIVVARADAREEAASAAGMLQRVRATLPGAYLQQRGKALAIAHGRFSSPSDPQAQAELKRIRELSVDGQRPFAGAVLAPPLSAASEAMGPFDLRAVREARGPKEDLYSLQVAVYGRDDRAAPSPAELAQFRAAANEAVRKFRAENEEAYVHHGASTSSVTLGVFTAREISPVESAALTQLRRKHPNLLLNGMGIRRWRGAGENKVSSMESSVLVEIPRTR